MFSVLPLRKWSIELHRRSGGAPALLRGGAQQPGAAARGRLQLPGLRAGRGGGRAGLELAQSARGRSRHVGRRVHGESVA